ncbi:MAG: (Fe-S)-binding protein [Methanobacteriota archaeon]|nr:MAG: (Fe-S)-binding protein [Euryarchaeota archaeon]
MTDPSTQADDVGEMMEAVSESCVYCRCGCCKDGCPVYEEVLEESMSPKGRNELIRAVLKGIVEPDERAMRIAYSCLLCRRDEESCGARLKNSEAVEQFRAFLLRRGLEMLPEHRDLANSLRNYGNPWGQARSSRKRWASAATWSQRAPQPGSNLLFVGCTFALDRSLLATPRAVASIMDKTGGSFQVMLEDEVCCGSTIKRIGEERMFSELRKANCESILFSGARRVVTPCSGCYKTIAQDYGDMLQGVEVMHSTQYILEVLRSQRLRVAGLDATVTYHDPCHLGRYAGIYDEPREILGFISGLSLVEMRNSRELSMCCGGGGGVKTAYGDLSLRVARKRVREAERTGASILVTACPFCVQTLSAASESLDSSVTVEEISVLVDRLSADGGGGES